MNEESARKLIKNTFQDSFNKERYIYFIKNLLKRYDESKAFHLQGCYIPKAFENFIKTFERIGTYIDPEGKKIDLLIVYLKKEITLDRARTAQRNFVANYLKKRDEKDAGLIAFVSPQEEDWRFSFVKMEYKFEKTPKGDVKVKEKFTPARRYSFLVGKNESSHTAQSCFVDILINDTHSLKLNEIEEAFSIEKVTKEFFEKYRELFLQIKDSLDKIVKKEENIREEFREKEVNVVDFSKKLLGQIVFLYFLQKKGWFGVKEGQKWGTGPKNFLRELFEKNIVIYRNFFNDVLEPLFYEALRNDRSHEDHYFSYFNCKIPFLNGGLFDPINDYNWAKTDILLPDNLFSNNNKTKEGDIGTGILDIFDRYNFTVKEDEPLEKEVAVDPEMLGKVFENLLEVKDRKSKGTYYTPREIVHYMCQQSLINYLATELSSSVIASEAKQSLSSKEDIEKLIKHGDSTVEHNHTTLDEFSKNPNYKGSYKNYKLPQSIVNNAEIIDDKLKSIKVCDPAVGSGAFLVGMMNEIIRARNALTPILLSQKDSINQSMNQSNTSTVMLNNSKESRTMYDFKRHAIQNCLYGVDIDPGAVEIAKLRLWLSLIVDEEDIRRIRPLPNLDYKIVCGNSLLGVERNLENWKLFTKLEELKPLFFNETNPTNKQTYKKQIDNLISKITNGHKDFDFEVYFSEVFHNKGGFNVVIGNPPYVDSEKMVRVMPKFRDTISESYITAKGNWDLYIPFWELGVKLLNNGGNSVFITPNKWLAIGYGKNLRELLRSYVYKIGNCDQVKVFEAGNSPVIVFINKSLNNNAVQVDHFDFDYNISEKVISQHSVLNGENWGFLLSRNLDLILKIMRSPQKVSQDYYAENPFTVSEAYEVQKILIDLKTIGDFDNSKYFKFVNTGTIEKYYFLWSLKLTTYLKKKYQAPIIERHVFKKKFPKRFDQMSTSKIIISGMRHFECALDPDGGMIAGKSTVILKGKNNANIKIILALLNSNLISFFIKEAFGVLGIGGGINFTAQLVENLPLPSIDDEGKKKLRGLADGILKIVESEKWLNKTSEKAKIHDYEKQIDQIVYKLYDLTEEEIKIVEGKNKMEGYYE